MPNSDISCVTSNVSVVPCSISAELPSKVETWKLVQLCLVDAKGRNISKWVHSNGAEWLVSWKQVCHTMTLRLVQGTDHSMGWLPSCPHCRDEPCSFNHTVDSTLEYCNGFGPVCCNSSSPSFEGWTSGSHANALASIDQRPHKRLRLQWSRERRHWHAEWRNVVFSDESRFNMSCNEGRIRVRRYAGERNLRACILQQHRAPTPSVMVWGAIGYNKRPRFLRIEGNRNIREVLQPEVLPLLQANPHTIFQQYNARPHVARIVQAFFQRWWVSLLPWPARSPDMSFIEHVWDMVGRRLIRQGPPAPTLDALWTRIQIAWRDIPQEDIQGLFDSMPRHIETLIAAHGGFTPY